MSEIGLSKEPTTQGPATRVKRHKVRIKKRKEIVQGRGSSIVQLRAATVLLLENLISNVMVSHVRHSPTSFVQRGSR